MPPVDGPALARDDRKRAGAWYTPADLARRIMARALDLASGPVRQVLDPFCGAGAILAAAGGRGLELVGVDRDPVAAAACRAAVPGARVVVGDALLAPEFGGVDWRDLAGESGACAAAAGGAGAFDVVASNPPWEVIERSRHAPHPGPDYADRLRRSGYRLLAPGGKLNLYRLALERGLSVLRPGGVLAFVVPAGFLRDTGSAPLRRHFLEAAQFEEVWELASGRDLFPSAHRDLPVCAVFVRRGGITRQIRLGGGLLSREALRRFSPDLHAIPALARPGDAELLESLSPRPPLRDQVPGLRKGDLNLATDRALFRAGPTPLALRTGKEISPAGARAAALGGSGAADRAAGPALAPPARGVAGYRGRDAQEAHVRLHSPRRDGPGGYPQLRRAAAGAGRSRLLARRPQQPCFRVASPDPVGSQSPGPDRGRSMRRAALGRGRSRVPGHRQGRRTPGRSPAGKALWPRRGAVRSRPGGLPQTAGGPQDGAPGARPGPPGQPRTDPFQVDLNARRAHSPQVAAYRSYVRPAGADASGSQVEMERV
ncbi:MAG: N-6 DNA methylase [Candidatus Sericytochromatia bacterium]|nr:N-6 DNA methylase [Candidatus Tanganyikabacteria bacterium]